MDAGGVSGDAKKALADVFFDAFMGNGNIRYLPASEPVAIVTTGDDVCLSIRTSRMTSAGKPTETTQLEFAKNFCIACIGEDIPEALLSRIGVPLVTGGPANKSRAVVTPLLETRQPNVYLAGDVLSPAYFETTDFAGDPAQFTEVKRRGNIKSGRRAIQYPYVGNDRHQPWNFDVKRAAGGRHARSSDSNVRHRQFDCASHGTCL